MTRARTRSPQRGAMRPRRGSALIIAVLCLTVVGIVAAASAEFTLPHARQSRDRLRSARALALAEGGAAHAVQLLKTSLTSVSLNRILLGPDSIAGTADDGQLRGLGIPVGDQIPAAGVALSTGSYFVQVIDDPGDPTTGAFADGNGRVIARCRGVTTDSGVAEIDVLIGSGGSSPAVLFQGSATISGNPTIQGNCGTVHANGNLAVTGTTTAAGTVSSSGSVTGGKTITTNGQQVQPVSNAPTMPVASLTAQSQCKSTDVVLNADGTARLGTTIWNATSTHRWGWRRTSSSPVKWEFVLGTGSPAAISGIGACVTGNVYIGSNPGTSTNPFVMSIYATGSIEISGTAFLRALDPNGWLLLAEGDVSLQSELSLVGSVYGRGHCSVGGEGRITGTMQCLSEADGPGDINLTSENRISGDAVFTSNCTGPTTGVARFLGWSQRF
jgi:hypothetical protein